MSSRLKRRQLDLGAARAVDSGYGRWELGAGVRLADLTGVSRGIETITSDLGEHSFSVTDANVEERGRDSYAYLQHLHESRVANVEVGLRLSRFGLTDQFLVLPRIRATIKVHPVVKVFATAGRHAQPPLYREFITSARPSTLRAQRSDQISAGLECRPGDSLLWRSESYYRRLSDLVSYSVDDLQVTYSGRNDGKGYAYGVNSHLRGQMGSAVGIVSYGYLVTREDIDGDGRGYIPRPSDQRHTISAYLEDRMSVLRFAAVKASRFHLRILLGSGLPFTPKIKQEGAEGTFSLIDGLRNSRRSRDYFRFDMGLTQQVVLWGEEVELREEISNIYNDGNVLGYTYFPTPSGKPIELPNTLGRRLVNAGLLTWLVCPSESAVLSGLLVLF